MSQASNQLLRKLESNTFQEKFTISLRLLLLCLFCAVHINRTCGYGHGSPESLSNHRNHSVTAFMPTSRWMFSECPKQTHTNTFMFCSWLKCLSRASPSSNFRGFDTNRNVGHWLWKFIFGAANLSLAEDGEVMIAT